MMKKLLSYDILLQWRQGFWLIYFIVCLIYLAILFSVSAENRLFLSIVLVLSDTSVLGITFVGALILLEKQQNVLHSLFVTPLRVNHYLWSKTISLGSIAATMSSILLILPNTADGRLLMQLFVVVTSSVIFTLLGIGFASRVETMNQYFMNILAGSMVIIIPVVPFILWDRFSWLVIFPLNATLELMFPERFLISNIKMGLDVGILMIWCGLALRYARWQMIKNIIQKS